eukprot:4840275-Pleurochrysis_carterae.AAC.7
MPTKPRRTKHRQAIVRLYKPVTRGHQRIACLGMWASPVRERRTPLLTLKAEERAAASAAGSSAKLDAHEDGQAAARA